MKNNSVICIFVPLLPLAVAQAQALDCSLITNQEMCNEIQNANISSERLIMPNGHAVGTETKW